MLIKDELMLRFCGLLDRGEALDLGPALLVPSEAEKAAAEQLTARSLLLAGQAGLCCNPTCATRFAQTLKVVPLLCSMFFLHQHHPVPGNMGPPIMSKLMTSLLASGVTAQVHCDVWPA